MAPITPTTRQMFLTEVVPHIAELRRYAYALTRNWADADDLLQDTMARAMLKLHLWEPGTRIVPWLAVMMRNIRRSAYSRAWNKVQWCELEEFDSVAPPPQLDSIELKETDALWSRMPEHHRQVLDMIALDGLSYEEAADRLGIPVGTVRSRLFRARDALRSAAAGDEAPRPPAALVSGWNSNRLPIRARRNRPDGPQRVMLVEDEILPAMMLEEVVRDAGFVAIGPVGRLQEAIDLARAERIDAAVLDVRLDRDMVFPVADILKGRRIPFAFVTALPESEIKLPHRSRPVWSKPIDRPRLRRSLQALLEA